MNDRETFFVLVREIPAPVHFWIVPPVPTPPFPLTVRPLVETVLFRIMPLAGPPAPVPAVMLRKVAPLAPIVVLLICSAVPAVELSVLTVEVLFCVATIVPPPVHKSDVPEAEIMPMLLNVKVLPVFVPVRLTPFAALVAVTVRSRIVAPVVMLFPRIPLPAVGLIERSSTRLFPPSVTIVAPLLSTGVVLAGKASDWLNGASVMPASLSAVVMLIAWPAIVCPLLSEMAAPA